MASPVRTASIAVISALALSGAMLRSASATPSILVDAASGEVLDQQEATRSWFPASTAKLMTVYAALDAVSAGRITLNTPMVVSPRALSMAPSKMGFSAGTQVTLENALKMLMVKSANDIAVTIAEGVGGSVENFANEMNAAAARIGMRESRFTNPNGLPDPRQVSSARDLALLARALLQRFPEHADLFDIGALRFGNIILPTHNGLLGRYPGADGMKTGFTCAAGFNVVATATRGGRRMIAVVLGAPSATARTMKAAALFNRGFAGHTVSTGQLASLSTSGVSEAPDQHEGVCRNRGKAQAKYIADIEDTAIPLSTDLTQNFAGGPERSFLTFGAPSAPQQVVGASAIMSIPRPVFTPVDVFVGPVAGWTGPVAHPNDYDGSQAATATAFAASKAAETPLKPSADALPMKRGKTIAKASKPAAKVASTAPAKERSKVAVKTAARGKAAEMAAKADADTPKPGTAKAEKGKPHVKIAKAVAKHSGGKPKPKAEAVDKPAAEE